MNYKLNSYLSILAIACAVAVPFLSATARELPVQAALTKPASYDIQYSYYSAGGGLPNGHRYALSDDTGQIVPRYTRTSDGIYYNYSHTLTGSSSNLLGEGLSITHTLNRSNSSWSSATPSGYYSNSTAIGADSTVGNVVKMSLTFDNQTNKYYKLYLDVSSNVSDATTYYGYVDNVLYGANSAQNFLRRTVFNMFLIPSYSEVLIEYASSSDSRYLDAWYLEDLGISDAYQAGYDAGYEVGEDDGYVDGLANNPNILINAAESLIGMFVNFTFILFSLELFGVSVLTVVGVLFGIVAIVWILKTIRG
jgi:hypothetical protein